MYFLGAGTVPLSRGIRASIKPGTLQTATRHDTGPTAGTTTWTSPLGHAYTKPGVWTAPARLPLDVTLPEPRHQPPDNTHPNTLDTTLIPEPRPVPEAKSTTTWDDELDPDKPLF